MSHEDLFVFLRTAGKGPQYNVFGSSKGDAGGGLDFRNYGDVINSLQFGRGNDSLTFGTGSSVTGNVEGGGGTNDLTLHAQYVSDHSILGGAVKNFTSITKTGAGSWLIMGQVPVTDPSDPHPSSPIRGSLANIGSIVVEGGLLSLLGANPDFSGTVQIDAPGTLSVQAQGISNATGTIQNNGTLQFDQPFNDTFAKQIDGAGKVVKEGNGTLTLTNTNNDYQGGTEIREGALAITSADVLGGANGNITLGSETIAGIATIGTLQLNGNIDLATTRDVILKDGGGIIDTQGYTGTVEGQITGSGDFGKAGRGVLVVNNGGNDNDGNINVYAGTLRVMSTIGTAGSSEATVYQGAVLDGVGTVAAKVVNYGTIAPGISGNGVANATLGRTLTINGSYSSSGGPASYVNIDSILGGVDGTVADASPTSKLIITGSASGPFTWVNVANHGGLGNATNIGIDLIETGGSTSDVFRLKPDAFLPDGTPVIVAGDWGYALKLGGNGGNSNYWYLNAVEHNGQLITPPRITVFDSVLASVAPFNLIGTLMQRIGNRSWSGFGQNRQYIGGRVASSENAYAAPAVSSERRFIEEAGLWTRVEGAKVSLAPRKSQTHQGRSDINFWRFEAGFDLPVWRPTAGSALIFGMSGHFAGIDNTLKKMALAGSKGSVKSNGQGFGATLTYYGEHGFYVDAVAKWTWYDSDIKSQYQGVIFAKDGNEGFGQVYSLELGKIINLGPQGFSITPQVQYVHNSIPNDSFHDDHGEKFSYDTSVGKLLRVGLGVNREWSFTSASGDKRRFELYGVGNMYHEFDGKTKMKHDKRPTLNETAVYKSEPEKWWAGASIGGTFDWCDSRYSVYAEVGYRTTLSNARDNRILHGEAGFRFNF